MFSILSTAQRHVIDGGMDIGCIEREPPHAATEKRANCFERLMPVAETNQGRDKRRIREG